MATTAKRVKDARKPKFKSRQHNRCQLCGRPRAYPAQVRRLPSVLPWPGAQGRDPGRCEIELVNGPRASVLCSQGVLTRKR